MYTYVVSLSSLLKNLVLEEIFKNLISRKQIAVITAQITEYGVPTYRQLGMCIFLPGS